MLGCVTVRWGGKEAGDEILHRGTQPHEGMPVRGEPIKMVKPVPPRRLVCKCGGSGRTVNVLIREICLVRRRSECRAVAPRRAVLTGQRSAEVVVPAGPGLLGRTETLGIDWWDSRTVIVAMIAATRVAGRPMWRYW